MFKARIPTNVNWTASSLSAALLKLDHNTELVFGNPATQGTNKIRQFKGEYSFLSNFYEHPLLFDGVVYPTLEHAFQAAKTDDPQTKCKIAEKATPGAAKRAGGRRGIVEDFNPTAWEAKKDQVMETLVGIKFTDPALARLLLETGDVLLEEGNNWNDTYWGVSLRSGNGQNKLGQILMKVRSRLTSVAR